MFRLEIFVDDKKLGYVLWALSGHVIEVKTPQPVINAKKTKNGVRAAGDTSGNTFELFREYLLKQPKNTVVNTDFVVQFLEAHGLPSGRDRAYYLTWKANHLKLIKRAPGAKGTGRMANKYVIVPQKERTT